MGMRSQSLGLICTHFFFFHNTDLEQQHIDSFFGFSYITYFAKYNVQIFEGDSHPDVVLTFLHLWLQYTWHTHTRTLKISINNVFQFNFSLLILHIHVYILHCWYFTFTFTSWNFQATIVMCTIYFICLITLFTIFYIVNYF
jgi:hypothetical protein